MTVFVICLKRKFIYVQSDTYICKTNNSSIQMHINLGNPVLLSDTKLQQNEH